MGLDDRDWAREEYAKKRGLHYDKGRAIYRDALKVATEIDRLGSEPRKPDRWDALFFAALAVVCFGGVAIWVYLR